MDSKENIKLRECTGGRQRHLSSILLLSIIPVGLLVALFSNNVYEDATILQSDRRMVSDILFSMEIGEVVHHLLYECDASILFLREGNLTEIKTKLDQEYEEVDKLLRMLSKWPSFLHNKLESYFASLSQFQQHLADFRDRVQSIDCTMKDIISFYNYNNDIMINTMTRDLKTYSSGIVWQQLVGYQMLVHGKEETGIEGAIGESIFLAESFDEDTLLWYHRKMILGRNSLISAKQYSSRVKKMIEDLCTETPLQNQLDLMRTEILQFNGKFNSVHKALSWFGNMTEYMNILKRVQDAAGQEIINILDEEISSLETDLIISIVITSGSLILSPLIVSFVYKLTKKLQIFAEALHRKTKCLEQERKRSDTLLHQLLPVPVVQKLRNNQLVKPEWYSSVSVYFSDIVGFTTICSQSSPLQVVEMLNLIYKTFDDRIDIHDVYKVETIGDAYMVASGLPQLNGNRHFAEICHFALEVLETISEIHVPHLQNLALRVRIGINSGPIVAGVVGRKMPRYCLFGDTVNVASKMESSGEPSKIQISETTYEGLSKYPDFVTSERGNILVEGKGTVKTYWLLGNRKNWPSGSQENQTF